ncbi:MAG: hypothetical protein Kow0047_15940 [Anaerolineae bacterium]
MTISRRWQSGAELGNVGYEVTTVSGSSFTVSTSKKKTGAYAFRSHVSDYGKVAIPDTAQFRVGGHFNHNGLFGTGTNNRGVFFRWYNGATVVGGVEWDKDTNQLRIYVGGTPVASVDAALAGVAAVDTWFHIGVDVKIDASAGWIYVYKDGVLVLNYDGNTATAGAAVNAISFPGGANNGWNLYIYVDDVVIDDTTGESAPAKVPDRRFVLLTPNANGDASGWTGSDGNNVDNYQLVDETPPNGDTDYVYAQAAGLQDLYNLTTYTVPNDMVIAAVISLAVARKAAAEDDVQIKPLIKAGTTVAAGDPQDLPTSYSTPVWSRWTTNPDTGLAWTQSDIDSLQAGIESAGTFV